MFFVISGFCIKRSLMLIIPRGVINGLLSNLPPHHGKKGTCSGRISLVVGAPTQKHGKPVVRRGTTLHLLASAWQHMKRTCLKEKLLKHTIGHYTHKLQESKVLMSQNECSQGHVSWLSVCWEGSLYSQALLNKLKASKEILSGDVSLKVMPHI